MKRRYRDLGSPTSSEKLRYESEGQSQGQIDTLGHGTFAGNSRELPNDYP